MSRFDAGRTERATFERFRFLWLIFIKELLRFSNYSIKWKQIFYFFNRFDVTRGQLVDLNGARASCMIAQYYKFSTQRYPIKQFK
jgi:hypothetical protein